jgi:fumarylpyruvate hydrolase
MTDYVVARPPTVSVPVAGSDARFPVRRVYCVGRNYADHALEMGVDPRAEEPFFFCKPADTVVSSADGVVDVPYPPSTDNLHHEVELVVAIGPGASVWGYAVGIDMTRRDLQQSMRKQGKPWEIGKVFECCAPIGPIQPKKQVGDLTRGGIELRVGGERRQASDLSKLIWSVPEILAALSRYYPLRPGDLVFTGTPEGVGPVQVGDEMVASIDGLGELRVRVTAGATR